jgi:hypothetical protein
MDFTLAHITSEPNDSPPLVMASAACPRPLFPAFHKSFFLPIVLKPGILLEVVILTMDPVLECC